MAVRATVGSLYWRGMAGCWLSLSFLSCGGGARLVELTALSFQSELASEVSDFGFEDEQLADPGQGETFGGHGVHPLDLVDLVAAVAALAALRAGGLDDALGVQPAQVRGLDPEHVRDLTDGVHRGGVIVDRERRDDRSIGHRSGLRRRLRWAGVRRC